MNSLAIWYQGDQTNKVIDVHINFWKLPVMEKGGRFLDVGLNLPESMSVDKIYIFIPFTVGLNDINDLGGVIGASSPKLLTAIFNEDYRITSYPNSDYYGVKDQDDNEVFNVYALNHTNFSIANRHDGTVIEISLPQKEVRKEKTYLRFRITGSNLAHFSKIEKDVSSILSNAFNKNEILDFRVNSARHLPNRLLEEMAQGKSFKITKIHFFYICSYCEDYTLSHQPFHSVRKLEDKIWDDYMAATHNLQNLNPKETFIAYHWKDKSNDEREIEDFNVFLKTNFRDKNWETIGKYMLYLLLFAICSGVIANYIFSQFPKSSAIAVVVGSDISKDQGEIQDGKKLQVEKERVVVRSNPSSSVTK